MSEFAPLEFQKIVSCTDFSPNSTINIEQNE